jgi:hypothetical protein
MKKILLFLAFVSHYAIAQESPHGVLNLSCATCHTVESWKMRGDSRFNHATTGFALEGRHQHVGCTSCHRTLTFSGQRSDCLACHADVHKSELGLNCLRCHTTQSWIITDMRQLHQQTRFPLVGRHLTAPCEDCHERSSTQRYAATPTSCIGCHKGDYEAARNPSHTRSGFPLDCSRCHRPTAQSWSTGFDHALTAFPLTGSHVAANCVQCHRNNQFVKRPSDCNSCHSQEYGQVTSPNHAAGGFDRACQQCHTTLAWSPSTFNHAMTNFPLTGRHVAAQCQSCHVSGNYNITYINCVQCHLNDFQTATNPNHQVGGFNQTCESCHSTQSWSPATFDHASTAFPLAGSHVSVVCNSCHVNDNYQIRYVNCYQCHQLDFARPSNPNHVTNNFSPTCEPCHTTTTWTPSTFTHTTTGFPLTGRHILSTCISCHVGGNYQIRYSGCIQCHQSDYLTATNPSHQTPSFNQICESCHSTQSWRPASFNHSTTGFPLTGSHMATSCGSCHVNGNYQLTYVNCYQCHQSNYQQVANPNHVTNNFSHTCQPCHNTTSWTPSTFSHNSTNFPLTGSHIATPCGSCHVNGNYQLTYVNCYQCHQSNYQQVANPNHVTNNFSHTCQPCHNTTSWTPSTFSHNSTNFPLTGSHIATPCGSCHVNGNYQLTYVNCYQCHQSNYQQAANPNHVTNNFSHTCQPCHSTTAWIPSTFSHSSTSFPLTGAHVGISCASCHVNGNYQLVYTDCYQCHASNYQTPTNPNHVIANFSHDCTPCHSTSVWRPSTMNHDGQYFRIYTGAHRNRWTLCTDCHTTPTNFALFSCIHCHEHRRSEMDDEHRNVPGYVYASPACYNCHRND